jgi:hypothetical protein
MHFTYRCWILYCSVYFVTLGVGEGLRYEKYSTLWTSQIHYSGHRKGWVLKIETFLAPEMTKAKPVAFGPKNVAKKSLRPPHINNRYINSKNIKIRKALGKLCQDNPHWYLLLLAPITKVADPYFFHFNADTRVRIRILKSKNQNSIFCMSTDGFHNFLLSFCQEHQN